MTKKPTRPRKKPRPKTGKPKKIDPRHAAFVQEYFYGDRRGNADPCAILAGYTPETANRKAYTWVGNSRSGSENKTLWDLVEAKREEIGAKYGITEQEIMDGYIRDERFDPLHLVNEEGLPETDLRKIPKDIRMSLKGVKVRQQILKSDDETQIIKQTSEFQYPDKKGNRDSMAKILGFLKDKVEGTLKGKITLNVIYDDAPKGDDDAEGL